MAFTTKPDYWSNSMLNTFKDHLVKRPSAYKKLYEIIRDAACNHCKGEGALIRAPRYDNYASVSDISYNYSHSTYTLDSSSFEECPVCNGTGIRRDKAWLIILQRAAEESK